MMSTLFILVCFCQSFEMSFEPPIIYNLNLLPTDLSVGSFAEYQVTDGDEIYRHVFSVEARTMAEGKQQIRVAVTRVEPEKVTLLMSIPAENQDLSTGSELKIEAAFGAFNIQSMTKPVMETALEPDGEETLSIAGKDIQSTRYQLIYTNGKKGLLWIQAGHGPLGILKARIWKQDREIELVLIKAGKRS